MAEEFLDGTHVVALFEETSCERVAEGMAAAVFGDLCLADGSFDRPLEGAFVGMVAVLIA